MTSSDTMTLADAFAEVKVTPGQAGSFLQWLASEFAGTEFGTNLRDVGIEIANPPPPKPSASSTTSTTKSS